MKKFLFILLFSLILIPAALAFAQTPPGNTNTPSPKTPCATCLTNPLSADSPQALIGIIINSVMGVVGSLALIMFIFGGFTWMTSGGSAEKIKKGRDILIWSAIGLVVIFASYGLVRFLILNIK